MKTNISVQRDFRTCRVTMTVEFESSRGITQMEKTLAMRALWEELEDACKIAHHNAGKEIEERKCAEVLEFRRA